MATFEELVRSGITEAPDAWTQGRAMFGGVVAAAALAAARAHSQDRPPITMALLYAGPVTGACSVDAEVIRSGRSYTSVRSNVQQDGRVRCTANISFGILRPDTARMDPPIRTDLPARDSIMDAPFMKGVMPNFLQNFAIRFAGGGLPYSGTNSNWLAGWIRHRGDCGEPHEALLGLMDAWPTPALSAMTSPHAASTVSWTVSFINMPEQITPEDWFYFDYRCTSAANGQTHNRSRIWDDAGRLVAEGRQLIAIYG